MPRQISGFLIDIDGVLMTGNQRIGGALETIQLLKEKGIPFLLVTNTTRQSRITIWHHLKRAWFPIEEHDIYTAPLAAVNWLKNKGVHEIHLMTSGSAVNDFKDFKITAYNPQYIVIGDIGKDITFDRLNSTFRLIMNGAKILALQKNRYWQTDEGLSIDAGAIVAGLEFATGKKATIIGKPSRNFFLQAAGIIGIPARELAMVGDDVESDVGGAQKSGMLGILVKTGKYRDELFQKSKIKPDRILNSIADLPGLISNK
jgi:HAD superfamily hydrolase (TIGR01458 family)